LLSGWRQLEPSRYRAQVSIQLPAQQIGVRDVGYFGLVGKMMVLEMAPLIKGWAHPSYGI